MTFASKVGLSKSYPFNIGVLIGRSITMLMCALFSGALFQFIPRIELPMKIIGAAYMLYLAYKCLRITINVNEKDVKISVFTGFLLQFINVKAYLSGINVMSSFILPHFEQLGVIIGFALLFAFIGFTASVCWGLFGSIFRALFAKHGKVINITMAVLLVYCAVSLFI